MNDKTRNNNWNLTINGGYSIQEVATYLNNTQDCKYYMIEHTENEEQLHIHLVIRYKNALTFKSIRERFIIYKPHIEPVMSLNKSIQYLIHKNDSTKKQYQHTEIITNDIQYKKYLSEEETEQCTEETELINDIMNYKFTNLAELTISQKYSMLFLQRRLQLIQALFKERAYTTYRLEDDLEVELPF